MTRSVRWIFAALAAFALAASFVFTPEGFPRLQLCLFRRMTGLSCPGCGLTRSFCALSHGEWSAAWGFHPFGYLFYAIALAFVIWPFVTRARPGVDEHSSVVLSRRLLLAGGLFVAGLFVFGFFRALAEFRAL